MSMDAFSLYASFPPDPLQGAKPCSVALLDKALVVGTKGGEIALLQVPEQEGSGRVIMKKRIGKKAVTQLEVINDLKVCLVLSDGKLCAHNIKTLVKNVNMIDVKNAAMFCVDNASPYHICVAIKGKKRLQVFRYLWKEERFEQTKELNVPDNPLAVSWAGQTLCIAFKREYSLLDIDIENVRDVSVPLPTNPLILTVENSELLLSSNNNLGIFINFQGYPVSKNPVSWTRAPSRIIRCSHYVIALMPDLVEVTSLLDQKTVQSIPFSKGIAIAANDKKVVLVAEGRISTLYLSSLENQIKMYLANGFVREAEKMLIKSRPSEEMLRDFRTNAGFVHLSNLMFKEGFDQFAKSGQDAREILVLFPELAVSGLPYKPLKAAPTVQQLIASARSKHRNSDNQQYRVKANMPSEVLLRRAHFFLSSYLWNKRAGLDAASAQEELACVDLALLRNCVEFAARSYALFSSSRDRGAAPKKWDAAALLRTDVSASLVTASVSSQQDHQEDTLAFPLSVADLLQVNSGGDGGGVGGQESKEEEEDGRVLQAFMHDAELFLLGSKQYNTLALLYQSKGFLVKALEVWAHLGSGKYLESSTSAAPSLGPSRQQRVEGLRQTVVCLSGLPPKHAPLIWRFSEWVLLRSPSEGMKVFTSTSRDKELPPAAILRFLGEVKARHPECNFDLVEVYLEHLVAYGDATANASLHTDLAMGYLKRVLSLHLPGALPSLSSSLSPLARRIPGEEPGLLGQARSKLFAFLRKSNSYDSSKLLKLAEGTDLLEERIILYSKLGQHTKVLEMFVLQLRDHDAAAQYCLRCVKLARMGMSMGHKAKEPSRQDHQEAAASSSRMASFNRFGEPQQLQPEERNREAQGASEDGEDGRDCFLILIGIYLSERYAQLFPQEAGQAGRGVPTAVDRAKDVLDKFACFVDPVQVLRDLDDSVPVCKLEEFLSQALPRTIHKRRHNQVVKGITRMNYLQTQLKYNEARSLVVDITAETRCPVCDQPVGDSIFSLHPSHADSDGSLASSSSFAASYNSPPGDTPASKGKNVYVITHYKCATKYRRGLRKARASQEKLRLERHQSSTNQTYL